jgi:virginiamycin A acetyltransferase
MTRLKERIQKLLGFFLSEPIILPNKSIGFSLVKSQRYQCQISIKTKIFAPYYLLKVKISDYSYIARNSNVSNAEIGKFCSIGPNFKAGLGRHPTNGISTSPMFYSTARQNGFSLVKEDIFEESKSITIGNDVFIGANVTVLDGVKIADGAIIGAGAVVTKDIPPYAIAVGIPAKVIKYRFDKDIIEGLLKKKWWNLSSDKLNLVEKHFFDLSGFLNKI